MLKFSHKSKPFSFLFFSSLIIILTTHIKKWLEMVARTRQATAQVHKGWCSPFPSISEASERVLLVNLSHGRSEKCLAEQWVTLPSSTHSRTETQRKPAIFSSNCWCSCSRLPTVYPSCSSCLLTSLCPFPDFDLSLLWFLNDLIAFFLWKSS